MNDTSNMNSGTTGGVCSSCLKEMPIVMASSSTNPLSKLCSNCMTEFVDQQRFTSDMSNKFPLLSPTQSLLHNQQQTQSIFQSHFSSLPSSSASSTSSSISSTNRRLSVFDPFISGNLTQSQIHNPLTDLNNTYSPFSSSNFKSDFDLTTPTSPTTATSNDFIRFFQNFPNGNNNNNNSDRDSPASSIQSNDLSQTLFSRQQSTISSSSLNRLITNDRPSSSFCCFSNNPPYTYCLDCETSLCEKCALTHPKILSFKDHRQQLLSSPINQNRSIIGQQQQPPPTPQSPQQNLLSNRKILFSIILLFF